jgi:hypothetical protein
MVAPILYQGFVAGEENWFALLGGIDLGKVICSFVLLWILYRFFK